VFKTTPKMLAKNHFPEIIGINLEYAVEAYEWESYIPMTEEGVIVSGFWDKRKGVPDPKVYELDEHGLYVRKD